MCGQRGFLNAESTPTGSGQGPRAETERSFPARPEPSVATLAVKNGVGPSTPLRVNRMTILRRMVSSSNTFTGTPLMPPPTYPLLQRYPNKGLANWAVRKLLKTKERGWG